MSQTKAHPEKQAHKTADHNNNHEAAEKTFPGHQAEIAADPIPAPEQGGHAHSHAAHLETPGDVNSKPAGNNLHEGVTPGALRQPASIAQRNGKQHR